ncbi:tetratricopeptide repeat protein [Rhodoferax aquaticus]|uniref:Tetratricopeptide repeat protein n=1 Tax=Rhodoferax aquaticus TaxID=2527691 RepID=A0A515EM32_9BURK|nr:tetratricopeptide repeat protein [Rhodoferax aquaticus]QDL53711.1 tetratricopeptide repeat protein [Rhodoferax aquaticus]
MFSFSGGTRTAKWLSTLALAAFSLGAIAQAEPSLNQVYETAQSGQLDKAQTMMQQVLVAHPNSAKAHFVQAELQARQGRAAQARESLATAEKLAPGLTFAKPEAVQALRAQLAASPGPAAATRTAPAPAAATPFPWALAILAGSGLLAFAIYTLGKKRKPAASAAQQDPSASLLGPQTFGQGTLGNGVAPPYSPAGYAPNAYGQAPSSGLGGKVMGGLAAGLAVGAGVMAAEAIGSRLMGSGETHPPQDNSFANNDFAAPHINRDMGGPGFGVNDSSSWDDGASFASNDAGGGDWDS